MASLPSISAQVFLEEVELPSKGTEALLEPDQVDASDVANETDSDTDEILPSHCLFCNENLSTLELNLEHMSLQHSLFIPEQNYVTDMGTFISYLASIIGRDHECLYCGMAKATTEGIKQHMRDRGHCLINFDGEPELLEFWEFPDSDAEEMEDQDGVPRSERRKGKSRSNFDKLSDTEIRLQSGTVVGSRSKRPRGSHNVSKRAAVRQAKMKAVTDSTSEGRPSAQAEAKAEPALDERRVAVRGELGTIGVPEQQRRALLVVEKKMQKREIVARAAQHWAAEKVANKQKHYRAAGPTLPGGMRPNG